MFCFYVPEWRADQRGCEDLQEGLHPGEQGEVHERSMYVGARLKPPGSSASFRAMVAVPLMVMVVAVEGMTLMKRRLGPWKPWKVSSLLPNIDREISPEEILVLMKRMIRKCLSQVAETREASGRRRTGSLSFHLYPSSPPDTLPRLPCILFFCAPESLLTEVVPLSLLG